MSKKAQGYWKGKPVEYAVVIVAVTNRLGGVRNWATPFIGKNRQAVKVMIPNHRPFYLDNEDGTGLHAIVKGEKNPELLCRSLGDPKLGKEVPQTKWNKKINKKKTEEINKISNSHWRNR